MKSAFVAAAFAAACVSLAGPARADYLVWTDNTQGFIYRSDVDGSNRSVLRNLGATDPRGIAVDSTGGMIYWAENGGNRIRRARLDGSDVQTIVAAGLAFPADVELDLGAGKVYWADRDTDRIQRANLDGSGVETVVNLSPAAEAVAPYFLELDPAGGKVYWSDFDSGIIHRANLADGTLRENVVTGLDRVRDIAIDIPAGRIYWNDRDDSIVARQNLAGRARETLYGPAGLVQPHGLVLHDSTGMLYWADGDATLVGAGPKDGGVAFSTIADLPAPFHPWDIDIVTVVPEPATGSLLLVGGAMVAFRFGRRRRVA